jgi:ComF family protein
MTRRAVFCGPCALSLETEPPQTASRNNTQVTEIAEHLAAFGSYEGALAIAIQKLKYHSRADLAPSLGSLLVRTVDRDGLRGDLVVPVPLHPLRLAERGFNQAALLARVAARQLDMPFSTAALVRRRVTPPQAKTSAADRWRNVAGAFIVPRPARVAQRHILLVDDVATTGATLEACRRALRTAGAESVTGLVLARALEIRS